VVVKTTAKEDLIADLAETFVNLWHYRWKLNPKKCVFGVPSGKLLGFMVSHRGIEANPTKVDAIRKMKRPTGKKDDEAHWHDGGSRSLHQEAWGERPALLLAVEKVMLEELKTFFTTPPIMVPPTPKEALLLYISTST
jgi:hypothetical protein